MKRPQPRKDVLIADGLTFYRRMLVELLLGQGYRVTEASDTESTLHHLETETPDLVLLDLQLPPDGALPLLEEVARRRLPSLRIVGIAPTGYDDTEWQRFRAHTDGPCITRSAPIDDILVAARDVLFPEAKNLRRTPRTQAHIPLTYATEGADGELTAEVTTHSFNLSADGMFVVTTVTAPCAPGTKLHLRFWVPGAEEVIRTEGIAIWCNQAGSRMNELYPPGMGVMFLGLPPRAAGLVADYVRDRSTNPRP